VCHVRRDILKLILFLKVSGFLLITQSFNLFSQNPAVKLISISSSQRFALKPISAIVCTINGLAARESFEVKFGTRTVALDIYYKPKKGATTQQILEIFRQTKVTPGSVYFGMGSSYDKFLNNDPTIFTVSIGRLPMQKFASLWGSSRSHDIIVYRLLVKNHEIFDEVLITFLDAYGGPIESEPPLSNEYIAERIKSKDSLYAAYPEIEAWMQSWKFNQSR
jgi:hypothetical protein